MLNTIRTKVKVDVNATEDRCTGRGDCKRNVKVTLKVWVTIIIIRALNSNNKRNVTVKRKCKRKKIEKKRMAPR